LEQITLPKGSLNTLTSIIDSIINEFELNKYNSMIITGSSFPETLSGIQAWSIIKNPRKEFIIWQELREKYPDLIFGDYVSDDPKDPSFNHKVIIIPTIRYTYNENWYIFRGEHDEDKPYDYSQFHKLSQDLVDHHIYCGKDFSWSDKRINNIANTKCKNTNCNHGNAESWVQIAVNHHISFVVNQLQEFF